MATINGFPGYAGWGQTEAEADFKATGGAGKGGPSGGGGSSMDPIALMKAQQQMMIDANKPVVESLEASRPEIASKYQQTREQLQSSQAPLEQRYKDLLDSIKGNQAVAENRQTLTTNNELGRRGITGSSGVAQQEITNAVNPITQQYTGMAKETGLAREEGIRDIQNQIANLTPQETADMRGIQNLIAQLQSGAASQGAQQGLSLYSTNLQNQMQQQSFAEQQKQSQIANQLAQAQQSLAEKQYNQIQLPQSQAALQPKPTPALQTQFGGGW